MYQKKKKRLATAAVTKQSRVSVALSREALEGADKALARTNVAIERSRVLLDKERGSTASTTRKR